MEYIYYFILCQKKPEIVYGVYILLYTMPEEARDSVWSTKYFILCQKKPEIVYGVHTTLYYARISQR